MASEASRMLKQSSVIWPGLMDAIVELEKELEARQQEIDRLRAALTPFCIKNKMPSGRRILVSSDLYGLRRIISPLELARMEATNALKGGDAGDGAMGLDKNWTPLGELTEKIVKHTENQRPEDCAK